MEDRLDVSELIDRISAERGEPVETTGRHRLLPELDSRRSRRRRLAPVAAGVATVLVAAGVALTLRPGDAPTGPELDAALVGVASAEPTGYPAPDADPADQETAPATSSRTTATATAKATIKPAAVRSSAKASRSATTTSTPRESSR
jgi:hypothetical protein